jgi:integrase
MPRKANAPLYTRGGRYWLDARAYADVGGGREKLAAPGETLATKDSIMARDLAAKRVRELERLRREKTLAGVSRMTTLRSYADHHLVEKAKESDITDAWMEQAERHLQAALGYFGDVPLTQITVERVREYASHLTTQKTRGGRALSGGTRRHYLNSLSNLFRRAAGEGYVLPGYNPVAALMHKPTPKRRESRWLEVHDAALLIEAARTYKPKRRDATELHILESLTTFLLSGGREAEVLGLDVEDLSFDRKTITFRPNPHRRLKTRTSHRTVPMWPQLEEVLRPYVFGGDGPKAGLLFPSYRGSEKGSAGGMITDLRKTLDAVAARAGWPAGEIRTKIFRHTYCAARLQTLDRGAPVSEYTVARELGHGGFALVRRVYGHLGQIRHRSEVVEYRTINHMDLDGYADRVRALQTARH